MQPTFKILTNIGGRTFTKTVTGRIQAEREFKAYLESFVWANDLPVGSTFMITVVDHGGPEVIVDNVQGTQYGNGNSQVNVWSS
jgi:hypothetical protein